LFNNNKNLLTGLTGLADRARLAYRVANQWKETPSSEPTNSRLTHWQKKRPPRGPFGSYRWARR
jgi:hypothetical protein